MKQYIILNTSRKHVNYEEDKNKVPMNKPYNIQNTNICNGIFHISFFKALLINEDETTRDETTQGAKRPGTLNLYIVQAICNLNIYYSCFVFIENISICCLKCLVYIYKIWTIQDYHVNFVRKLSWDVFKIFNLKVLKLLFNMFKN